jgi:hypothetical protein
VRDVVALLVVSASFGLAVGCGAEDAARDGERLNKREYLVEVEAVGRELQTAMIASVTSNFSSPGFRELAELDDDLAETVEDCAHLRRWRTCMPSWSRGSENRPNELRELAEVQESQTSDPIDAIVKLSEVKESSILEEAAREFRARGYDVPEFFGGS